MIRAIAIDDEPLALQVLQNHAAQLDYITIERTFTNAMEGIAYLHRHQPAALFLDIQMHDHNGLEIAETLIANVQVIFTTAYAAHALRGFELAATDYLLKPISFHRFSQACEKIKERTAKPTEPSEIIVKENGIWHKVPLAELMYIEARGNYLYLATSHHSYIIRQTLHELEKTLPAWFVRCHKSYIVNTKQVSAVTPLQLTVGAGTIPISPGHKNELFKKMGLKPGS
ncbi:MAG: LytTR family DNA-binding domain-containing protein [Taibaiella sp.]|nr:LytTR family DNA-binding domain-containing protein [Taibaiella sp.]